MFYIGLDIGGTKCAAVLGKVEGADVTIENKVKFATAGLTPNEVLGKFSEYISGFTATRKIETIGISCGGPLDSKRGIIMKPPSLPLWDDIKIVEYFETKFGITTRLQNDANACAVAEWKFGAGKNCDNMVFLTFGTGFGAGLILNGKLYSGANDNAGEIGHIRLTQSGPMGYYKAGSCEGYCSGGGIARMAQSMAINNPDGARKLVEKVGGVENITAKDIAELAKDGDTFCVNVYKKSGGMLGRSLSIIVDLINPDKIVIGGVFMRSAELLVPEMERVMRRECLSHSLSAVKVVKAGLGESVGDYAALAIACGGY